MTKLSDSTAGKPSFVYVHWRSLLTGETGHGEPVRAEVAEAEIGEAAKTWAGVIVHWTRPALPPDEVER